MPSTMVYCAAWFLIFLAPHLLLGTSLASKYLILFEAHFGAHGLISIASIPTTDISTILNIVGSGSGALSCLEAALASLSTL